jgi:thiol:disulfide interchange protein DsbD
VKPAEGTARRFLHATLLLLAAQILLTSVFAARDVKRPEEVFRYEVSVAGNDIVVAWDIADGYYLYRDKMKFQAEGAELGTPLFPAGEIHADEFFGEQIIFRDKTKIRIPLLSTAPGAGAIELQLRSQGCADYGLCYPPQDWTANIKLPAASQSMRPALSDMLGTQSGRGDPLPVDQAFVADISAADPFTLEVRWTIAPGYYLYKKDFAITNPAGAVQTGALQLPTGTVVDDLEFGEVEVFYAEAVFRVPLSRASPAALTTEFALAFQGCKEDSICYPPATALIAVELPAASASDTSTLAPPVSEQDRLTGIVTSASLPTIMLVFLGLGLLLAFTPCCLPMVPILSGIIAGQGENVTTAKAFWLSLSYVLGMAFTYTIAGAVFGAAGGSIQAALQTPLIIGGVALLFVVLSLAMFGVYELQLPAALQTRLSELGNKGKAGSFIGTAIMGAVSALVVSTCVAPPLVAALAVIAQTGDVARGAFALFSLSIGMGIPLIVFGTSAGKLLPKAGAWMNTVKGIFGFMLLGLAIWMLDRLLPSSLTMFLWAALAIGAGVWSGAFTAPPEPRKLTAIFSKLFSLLILAYGGLLLIGAVTGATSPLQPLVRLAGDSQQEHGLPFTAIKSVADFEAALAEASANNQPVMLDFYADWCVSCKEMEAWTFTDPRVQKALKDTVLLQADVTANDEVDQALLKQFGIFGPPTIVFFDRRSNEIEGQRVIGYMNADDFLTHLDYVLR